jgi:hypothetical protein
MRRVPSEGSNPVIPNPPPSEKQLAYVESIQKRLHLPDALLDNHCQQRFRKPFRALSRSECSDLLDEMIGWESLPADFQRAKGQRDLFELV